MCPKCYFWEGKPHFWRFHFFDPENSIFSSVSGCLRCLRLRTALALGMGGNDNDNDDDAEDADIEAEIDLEQIHRHP